MPKSSKGQIVIKYLDKNNNIPSLTLAKIIFQENGLEFKDVEDVRSIIRYYRNQRGDSDRRSNSFGNKYTKPGNLTPYRMPDPESEDFKPHILQAKSNNIGVISDLHIPNHRTIPVNLAFDYFKKEKINTLLINGDLLDNTPFSRHEGKRPSASDVRCWFDKTELFLEYCRDSFPKAEIIWLEGNHDYWYRRWMNQHAWQLDEDPYFSLQERLHIEEYKITFLPQTRYLLAGNLAVCHGHHLIKGIIAPVNAARGLFNRAKVSSMIGHVHVESSHTETDLHGKMVTCWSTGCLCTLTPEYQPMGGKACHGFAHIKVEANKDFSVRNFRIDKGKIL